MCPSKMGLVTYNSTLFNSSMKLLVKVFNKEWICGKHFMSTLKYSNET